MARDDLVGQWVYCTWNFDAGNGHPHPQDGPLIPKEWFGDCVARCVAIEDEYIALSHEERIVRIAPFGVSPLPVPPQFHHGQRVQVRPSDSHSFFAAPVRKLTWHFKHEQYVYWLVGKKTRYFESELEPA
jgi:hypothetical protein